MRNFATILLTSALLCACAVPRTPIALKQSTPPMSFTFALNKAQTVECLVPQLDRITPFNFPPDETRVPSVRELGAKTQIIAMDEDIALYVVELEALPSGTGASAFVNSNYPIASQLTRTVTACGGTAR